MAADLIISDIYGNALSTPIVIDVDRDAPEITAPNLKIEWDVDLDLVNSSETGKIFSTAGEKVIWSIDDGIMPTIRVFNADTGEQIDLPEEEYKYIPTMNILCLSYVGVEYEDNFCGKGLILKDNPSTIVDTTFDTVKDLDAMSSEYNRYVLNTPFLKIGDRFKAHAKFGQCVNTDIHGDGQAYGWVSKGYSEETVNMQTITVGDGINETTVERKITTIFTFK